MLHGTISYKVQASLFCLLTRDNQSEKEHSHVRAWKDPNRRVARYLFVLQTNDLRADLDDIVDAGTATTAFTVLAMLSGLVVIAMHVMIWPLNKGVNAAAQLGYPFAGVTCLLLLFSFMLWAAMVRVVSVQLA